MAEDRVLALLNACDIVLQRVADEVPDERITAVLAGIREARLVYWYHQPAPHHPQTGETP